MQKAYPPNNRINKPICTLEKLKTFHESHRKKETWPRPGSKLRGEGQGRFPLENAVGARMASEESTCRVACLLPAIREALDKNVFFPARKKKKKKAITLHTALMKRPRSSDPHQGRPGELTQSLLLGCSHQMLRVPGLGGKNAAPRWKRLSRAPSLPARLPLPSFKPRKAFSERNFSTPRWLRSMRSIRSPPR